MIPQEQMGSRKGRLPHYLAKAAREGGYRNQGGRFLPGNVLQGACVECRKAKGHHKIGCQQAKISRPATVLEILEAAA